MPSLNPMPGQAAVRFGPFETNPATGETRKYGIRIKLGGQQAAIPRALLERPGEVVSREELRQRLWARDTFIEFENGLNSAIKKLRRALGDSANTPLYIETVPRTGYRFIAPVETVSRTAGLAETSAVDDRPGGPPEREHGRAPRWRVALWAAILLIGLPVAYITVSALRGYFLPHHTTAARVGATVDGDRATEADSVGLSTKSDLARDLYLKGMYFWNQRTARGFQQAIEHFQKATAADPKYALAYAGLANSFTLLSAYSVASATLYIPEARTAAQRALDLAPNLAEAHTAMALIVENDDWDWQRAEKEFRRAIQLNPNYATGHQWFAELLMWRGRFDEALLESAKAQQLDPLSLIIAADRGAILYYSREYDRAVEQLRAVLRRDPNFSRAQIIESAYVERGQFEQARNQADLQRRTYGDAALSARLAYIYGRAGQLEKARRELGKLEKITRTERPDLFAMSLAHLALGDKEEALADLTKACDEHYNFVTGLKVEPAFDPLRGDPRFQELIHRVHLDN